MSNIKKLGWGWWLNSGGGLNLYSSTYRAFLAGENTLDYYSQGGLSRNPITGRLYHDTRVGSTHNTVVDGEIHAVYSDNNFITKNTVVCASNSGGVDVLNPDSFVTSTGRFLIFYSKFLSSGNAQVYFKYADQADLSDLSVEQTFTSDYSGKLLYATGSCFELNGVIYKSVWGSSGVYPAAQPTEAPLYKSTDNGITWTKVANISPSVDNYDETCIALHPNGTFWAFQRDNVTKKLIVRSSTNLGVTWSNALITNIPSQGKSPCVITPSGNFCIVTRHTPSPDFRTILVKSSDGISFTWDYFDEHLGAYEYAGLVWDGTKVQCCVAVEADNVATVSISGPTIVIYREIVESATPILPPTQYDSLYRCVLDYIQANGETLPSDTLKVKHNTLIAGLRSGGYLSGIHYMENGFHNDANLSGISLRDWMHPWVKALPVANPTFGSGGYTLNGTTQYLNFVGSRIDNITAGITKDDIGFLSYVPNNAADAAFGRVYGIGSTFLIPRASDGNCYFRVNSGTNTVFVNANGGGLFFAYRIESANQKLRRNSTQISTAAVASVTLVGQSDNFFMGALNAGGTPQNFTVKTAPIFVISKGFSGIEAGYETLFQNYIDSL